MTMRKPIAFCLCGILASGLSAEEELKQPDFQISLTPVAGMVSVVNHSFTRDITPFMAGINVGYRVYDDYAIKARYIRGPLLYGLQTLNVDCAPPSSTNNGGVPNRRNLSIFLLGIDRKIASFGRRQGINFSMDVGFVRQDFSYVHWGYKPSGAQGWDTYEYGHRNGWVIGGGLEYRRDISKKSGLGGSVAIALKIYRLKGDEVDTSGHDQGDFSYRKSVYGFLFPSIEVGFVF
jgi:hypothetical protein